MTAAGDGASHERARRMNAADQLDDDVAVAVDHIDRRPRDETTVDAAACLRFIAHETAIDAKVDAMTRVNARAFAFDELHEAAADRSTSKESDVQATHANTRFSA